jgi:hypothetical protein
MKDEINKKNNKDGSYFIIYIYIYIYIYKEIMHNHEKEISYYLTIIEILIEEENNIKNIPMLFSFDRNPNTIN